MVNEKILITGGNGYIGARLSLYLAQAGASVTPLCYPSVPTEQEWCNAMQDGQVGDVRDEEMLRKLAKHNGGFETVIQLVSLDHRQSTGTPVEVAAVNITPTWSLLDIFSKAGLKKFIYFSTMQVYGALEPVNITEEHPPKPANAYAMTHWLGEQLCEYYNRTSNTQCRVVRLSNSYGAPIFMENHCWWLVINDLFRMAFHEGQITLLSDGTPQRDFIHGWDVCRAVEHIVAAEQSEHPVYHISTGHTLTILEIAQTIQQIYQNRYSRPLALTKAPSNSNPVSSISARYRIDNQRLRELGFAAEWSLERGIHDLFDYLEQHQ